MNTKEHQGEALKPRKKKKKHRLYALIVLLLGAAIIALTVLILFYVQSIKVEGNDYCPDKEIVESVQNDRFSVNSLYVLGKYALGYGECLPCLESMKVRMRLPWELKVTVKEKPIVAYVYTENNYAYIDREGLVVMTGAEFIEGLPCIEGIEMKDISLYKKLKSDNPSIFEEILRASQELENYNIKTDKIICKDNGIFVYIGDVCVNLGSSVSSEQIAQIPPILEKLSGQAGTLHLEDYSGDGKIITFDKEEVLEEN